jgi:hypothetical protein
VRRSSSISQYHMGGLTPCKTEFFYTRSAGMSGREEIALGTSIIYSNSDRNPLRTKNMGYLIIWHRNILSIYNKKSVKTKRIKGLNLPEIA